MPEVHTTIDEVQGFTVAGVACGLKGGGALDFALIVSDRPCSAAGVFTTNHVKAAPVIVNMDRLARNPSAIRAVAVNTKCANACTGEQGVANALAMGELAAQALGVANDSVLAMSTGVIGTHLPMDKIAAGVELATTGLGGDWHAAASAIMTTDTRPKLASTRVTMANGKTYTIAGISKGSGMIAPNMATMLGVIVTDAALSPAQAGAALRSVGEVTFNRIVVDGDMSTNDTVLLLANGASGADVQTLSDEAQFSAALEDVCRSLAQAIVRDGEGVTKFITINVGGAVDDAAARLIANTIATSALVKTAFYGADANWGRIVAAAGRAGVPLAPERMRLWLAPGEDSDGALLLFENGMPTAYDEAAASGIMGEPSIYMALDCGMGPGTATIWTCDLSHDYVSINGHYRT